MIGEPDFLAQAAEPMSPDERRIWIGDRVKESKAQGCTFCRVSVDDADDPRITLFEGWKVRPEEQGEPRFMLASSSDKPGGRG